MKRKHDLFKVVFDPGADKREKGILRQIALARPLMLRRSLILFRKIEVDTGSVWLGTDTAQMPAC